MARDPARARRRSALSTALVVLRILMILAGVAFLGLWVVDSIGGAIHTSYFALALGLFVGAFGVSYLE